MGGESTTHNRSWGETADACCTLGISRSRRRSSTRSRGRRSLSSSRSVSRFVSAVSAAPRRWVPEPRGRSRASLRRPSSRRRLRRTTKAAFTNVAWGPEARQFAAKWDGAGVDPWLIDLEAHGASGWRSRRTFAPLRRFRGHGWRRAVSHSSIRPTTLRRRPLIRPPNRHAGCGEIENSAGAAGRQGDVLELVEHSDTLGSRQPVNQDIRLVVPVH